MEIKKGEYVRTCFGEIGECIDKTSECCVIKYNKIETELIFKENIKEVVKHSFNIIDLIENTDILQVEISEEWVDKKDAIVFIIVGQTSTIEEIKENLENGIYRIKSIVTKEQMKSVEYKIKEEK